MSSLDHRVSCRAHFCKRSGLLSAIAIATVVSLNSSAPAGHSIVLHPFERASVELAGPEPTIFIGHDGDDYTRVVGDINIRFRLKSKVKSRYRIFSWVVTTGEAVGSGAPVPGAMGATDQTNVRELDTSNAIFTMDASTAVKFNMGQPFAGADQDLEKPLIDRCNQAFPEPPADNQPAGGFVLSVHAGFFGAKKNAVIEALGDDEYLWRGLQMAIASMSVPARVVCLNAASIFEVHAPPQPVGVDIQVKSVNETCPKKTEVTAYVDYDEKTTAQIRAVRQGHVGRAAPWVDVKTREVTLGPKTWHRAEHVFEFDLDPGKHTFRVEVQHGPNSDWESIDLACPPFEIVFTSLEYETEEKAACPKLVEETAIFTTNGPGTIDYAIKLAGTEWAVRSGSVKAQRHGDGYRAVVEHDFPQNAIDKFMTVEATDISGPNDPGPLANANAQMTVTCFEVLSGTLDLRGFAATACEGEAALSIRTNQPGDVPYQLDCTGGKTWSGTAQTKQTGPDTFIAVGTQRFEVTNNERVNCALKTAKPLPVTVLALKGRKYECHKPADVGGTDDLVPKPRPTAKEPKSVAPTPKPKITCANGTVKDGACVCPRAHKRVKAGANAWRCVKTIVIEPPKVPIGCINGQVKNGTCVCPSAHTRVKVGTNAWRCVRANAPLETAPLRSTR